MDSTVVKKQHIIYRILDLDQVIITGFCYTMSILTNERKHHVEFCI